MHTTIEQRAAAMDDLAFVEEPRGANTWFVLPDDIGVFHGTSTRNGMSVAHPVQAYVDLDRDVPLAFVGDDFSLTDLRLLRLA